MAEQKAVLVVEHSPVGVALADAMRRSGWDVMLCHRGMQAIDSVRQQRWDALVIGFRLVDMRGDAVAHAAVAERPELAPRILLLTEDQMDAEMARGSPFAWLPFDAPTVQLVARLEELASGGVQNP